jgi:hypothetical protein
MLWEFIGMDWGPIDDKPWSPAEQARVFHHIEILSTCLVRKQLIIRSGYSPHTSDDNPETRDDVDTNYQNHNGYNYSMKTLSCHFIAQWMNHPFLNAAQTVCLLELDMLLLPDYLSSGWAVPAPNGRPIVAHRSWHGMAAWRKQSLLSHPNFPPAWCLQHIPLKGPFSLSHLNSRELEAMFQCKQWDIDILKRWWTKLWDSNAASVHNTQSTILYLWLTFQKCIQTDDVILKWIDLGHITYRHLESVDRYARKRAPAPASPATLTSGLGERLKWQHLHRGPLATTEWDAIEQWAGTLREMDGVKQLEALVKLETILQAWEKQAWEKSAKSVWLPNAEWLQTIPASFWLQHPLAFQYLWTSILSVYRCNHILLPRPLYRRVQECGILSNDIISIVDPADLDTEIHRQLNNDPDSKRHPDPPQLIDGHVNTGTYLPPFGSDLVHRGVHLRFEFVRLHLSYFRELRLLSEVFALPCVLGDAFAQDRFRLAVADSLLCSI